MTQYPRMSLSIALKMARQPKIVQAKIEAGMMEYRPKHLSPSLLRNAGNA